MITPKNRREIRQNFKENWIKRNENAGNPDNLTPEEIDRISNIVSNHQVRMEQKHHKAWLKGRTSFKYLSEIHPVLTPEIMEFQAKQLQAMQEAKQNQEEEE